MIRRASAILCAAALTGCISLPPLPRPESVGFCPEVDLALLGDARACFSFPLRWPGDVIRDELEERERRKLREERFRRQWYEREEHAARVLA